MMREICNATGVTTRKLVLMAGGALFLMILSSCTIINDNQYTSSSLFRSSASTLRRQLRVFDPKTVTERSGSTTSGTDEQGDDGTGTYFRIAGWNNAATATANAGGGVSGTGGGFYEIEIVNPNPKHKYAVAVESDGKYTGAARLLADNTNIASSGSNSLVYAWYPVVPLDDYRVIVHELQYEYCCSMKKKSKRVVQHGDGDDDAGTLLSVSLSQLGGETYLSNLHDTWNNAPSCSGLQNVDSLSSWGGHWIGPGYDNSGKKGHHWFGPWLPIFNFGNSGLYDSANMKLDNVLRSGWSLLPSLEEMNCKVDSFSRDDLLSIPPGVDGKERSIYVLGMSVTRGVFQTLLDMWLPQEDKENFMRSIIHRCWGRAELKKGNLKLTYQDFRVTEMESPHLVGTDTIECHNGIVSKDGADFLQNAHTLWEEIFPADRPEEWPDVVFFGAGYRWPIETYDFDSHVLHFVRTLPAEWKGKLIFSDGEFQGGAAGLGSDGAYAAYRSELRQMLATMNNDPRVRWLDGMGVSKDKRETTEAGPEYIAGSAHFHRRCWGKEVYLPSGKLIWPRGSQKMEVCSDILEVVGQMLIGQLLGPKDAFLESVKEANSFRIAMETPLETCTACPKDFMPFIIVPYPDMTCQSGPLLNHFEIDRSPRPPKKECPEHCLAAEPEYSFPSQSDTVYVRHCSRADQAPLLESLGAGGGQDVV